MQPQLTPSRPRRWHLLIAVITLVALLLPSLPAKAVWNGALDEADQYSNVGIVFIERTSKHNELTRGGPPDVIGGDYFCAGVLIAPTLAITSSACVNDPWVKSAYFSPVADYDPTYDWGAKDDNNNQLPFAPNFSTQFPDDPADPPDDTLAPPNENTQICRQPCYLGKVIRSSSSRADLAVLQFDAPGVPANIATPAQLPAYNSLNELIGRTVTSVGFAVLGCEGSQAKCDKIYDAPNSVWIENTSVDGRFIMLTERRSADMEVTGESGDPPKNTHKFLELRQTAGAFPCGDAGGAEFLKEGVENVLAGTLVAINFDFDCSRVTDVMRLDTPGARNFLCSKQFPELKSSLLCGGSGVSAAKAAVDDDNRSADRQGGSKHKNGKPQRGKGKRGR